MKSQKGVTMIGLILYVASFLAVTVVVAGITTFFYNNVEVLDKSIGSNSQYNKLNLYILNECKKPGNSLYDWQNLDFITFEDEEGNRNSFIYVDSEKNIYYNSIKLCEKVEEFKFKVDYEAGKTVLKVFVNIDGTTFTTEYVVAS